MIKAIYTLIICLPAILKMIEKMEKNIGANRLNRKVRQDIEKINSAFDEGNSEKLNEIFNS